MTYHISDDASKPALTSVPDPSPVSASVPSKRYRRWRRCLSTLVRSTQTQSPDDICEVQPPTPPPSAPAPPILSPVAAAPELRPRSASTDSPQCALEDDAPDEDDAARRIQLWLRDLRVRSGGLRGSMAQTISSSDDGSEFGEPDDELTYHEFEVFLWDGAALGLEFVLDAQLGLPRVLDARGNAALPGMWRVARGDWLVAIDDCSTQQAALPFEAAMRVLEQGMRPAVLRFRHARHSAVASASASRRSSATPVTEKDKRAMLYRRRCELAERELSFLMWREEDGPLGLTLKPPLGRGYPRIATIHPGGVIATKDAQVSVGDELVRINQQDVRELGGRASLQVLRCAPRPMVLTFHRRGRPTTTTTTTTSTTTTTAPMTRVAAAVTL